MKYSILPHPHPHDEMNTGSSPYREIYLGLGQLEGIYACGPGGWCPLSALLSGSLLFHWRVEFSTSCSGSKPWKAANRTKQFMIFHSLFLFCVGMAVSPSEGHSGPTSALTNQTFRCLNATVSTALPRLLGSPGLGEVRARSPLGDPAKDLAPPHTDAIAVKQLKLKQRTQFADVDRNHGYGCVLMCVWFHLLWARTSLNAVVVSRPLSSLDSQRARFQNQYQSRFNIFVFQRGERPS